MLGHQSSNLLAGAEQAVLGKMLRNVLWQERMLGSLSGGALEVGEIVPDCLFWAVPSPRHTIPPSSSGHWMTRSSKWKKCDFLWFYTSLFVERYLFYTASFTGRQLTVQHHQCSVSLSKQSQKTEPSHSFMNISSPKTNGVFSYLDFWAWPSPMAHKNQLKISVMCLK